MNTITPLICSECGTGNYIPEVGRLDSSGYYVCTVCTHTVSVFGDIDLDEGEWVTEYDGLLSVVTPA